MILVKPSFEILTKTYPLEILKRIEAAGRICYKSEDKITNESAPAFVRRIIKSGHESAFEHESISVRFIVDRGVTHELVRHRLAAFSQESTRYCDYSGGVTFIIPPWVNINPGDYSSDLMRADVDNASDAWFDAMRFDEDYYLNLLKEGWSPQQARSVLPNSLKTEIVMTANLREWRHVLKLRISKAAHPQMREIMIPLLSKFTRLLPDIFEDIVP
jgi:thymidylate synthase (FAD)